MVKDDFIQLSRHVSRFDLGVFNFLLYVLLFIGEVLIELTVTLNIGLLLQQIQRFFHALAQ